MMPAVKKGQNCLKTLFAEFCNKNKSLNSPLREIMANYFSSFNYGYLWESEMKPGDVPRDYMKELKTSADSGSLSICIGAGVTREYVGSWGELLNKLMTMRCYSTLQDLPDDKLSFDGKCIRRSETKISDVEDYMNSHITTFIKDSVNYLERGEYLMYDSADETRLVGTHNENEYRELFFAEQVSQAVADGIRKVISKDPSGAKSITEFYYNKYCIGKAPDDTLSGLLQLCIRQKIKEVVTYNFDTVFDRLAADPAIRKAYDPGTNSDYIFEIYSFSKTEPVLTLPAGKTAGRDTEVFKIYHVHGIVDEDCETSPLIFSENSYQSYQRTSLNWSNIHLADIMTRYNTLCVGFSGDDSNFRMLRHFLDDTDKNPVMGIDRNKKKRLYLMRDYSYDFKSLMDTAAANKQMDCAFACIKTYFDILITYFKKQLNTTIVWADGYDEMANQLIELSE